MDCSSPGSSMHEIPQARILEWFVVPTSRGSSQPRDQTHIPCIGRRILCHCATWGSPTFLVMVPVLPSFSCPTPPHPTSVLSWDHLLSQQLDLELTSEAASGGNQTATILLLAETQTLSSNEAHIDKEPERQAREVWVPK